MMAIEKSNFKVTRLGSEYSPINSREAATVSSDENELQHRSSDEDDEFDDVDSGAGSDDYDLLELGETGAEFCQFGSQTYSLPFELYDLTGLEDILSVDVWNECLSEEDKFGLVKYLPDMDQEAFSRTLTELLAGDNFHFGSPIKKLFEMLKGGLCEPRVTLYRDGLIFFQKRQHYHSLREHHNNMISSLCQIRDAWFSCRGYNIEEKLRALKIMKSRKSLYEKMEDLESDSSESTFLNKKIKDQKTKQKLGCSPAYGIDSNLKNPSHGLPVVMEPTNYMKQNPRGILKTAGSRMGSTNDCVGRFPFGHHGLDMNSPSYGSATARFRQTKTGCVSGGALRTRDQMRFEDNAKDPIYGSSNLQDLYFSRGSLLDKSGILNRGEKHGLLRSEEFACDSLMGLSLLKKKGYTEHASNMRLFHEVPKNVRHPENLHGFVVRDQMKALKGRYPQASQKGNRVYSTDHGEPFWKNRSQGRVFSVDSSYKSDEWNYKRKKLKSGRESPDLSYKSSSQQMNDRFSHPEYRVIPSQRKMSRSFVQNGGSDMMVFKRNKTTEETESDSSEHFLDDQDNDHMLCSRVAYLSSSKEGSRSLKSGLDSKNARFIKNNAQTLAGNSRSSKKMDAFGDSKYMRSNYLHENSMLHNSAGRFAEDDQLTGSDKFTDDDDDNQIPLYELSKTLSSLKGYSTQRKQKREVNYVCDYNDDGDNSLLVDDNRHARMGNKGQGVDTFVNDQLERSNASLLGCNSVRKKRLDMDGSYEDSDPQNQVDNSSSLKRKGKRKVEADNNTLVIVETSELAVQSPLPADVVELETKPQKKPFVFITPTVHTGFSFSIVHLLSAVRMAMITPLLEDSLFKHTEEQNDSINDVASNENTDLKNLGEVKVLSLTLVEIVNRVRSNPRDPCVLETQEPLNDLVWGVLKIFSSKTAPLGAKGWKTLVVYENSNKSWSWVGPSQQCASDETIDEEVTSPDFWGLPHKTLVKLVDSFANWLKSGQETLQQIGSLPAPPASLLEFNLNEKERFRDLKAQKSLNTIKQSTEEVRDYFRKEEFLRYSIPDRAFSYTAADGKKSIVAPLRRCGGKPSSKARDHPILKRDRPPHVTILCLVRDAAARLPGNIGTRADVCTLIRDSQYIVEDVLDTHMNQVVSGALDRLHYERDPCVRYYGDRKLWVYLHRERGEEDFEDDGTSSTKKWKKQKKDPAEQPEQEPVTVASADQTGFDLGSDLNAGPSCVDDDKKTETVPDDVSKSAEEENVHTITNHGTEEPDNIREDHPMVWKAFSSNPWKENKLLCLENSTNEDFEKEMDS